jgi:hypothetical protein
MNEDARTLPGYAFLLLHPRRIATSLDRIREARLVPEVPNLWQVFLGTLYMTHRLVFRSETVGTCHGGRVRPGLRPRLLQNRVIRFPFLLAERVVAPLDFSGLASTKERVIRHLLGAHHDGVQFVYDLELLSCHPGALEELREAARAVVEVDSPRTRWLRDLAVFEGYHERLLAAVEAAIAGELEVSEEARRSPDVTLTGWLRWCAAQPADPEATWEAVRRGEFSFAMRDAVAA